MLSSNTENLFQFTVPQNAFEGYPLRIKANNGRLYDVILPRGAKPGDQCILNINQGTVSIINSAPPKLGGQPMQQLNYTGRPVFDTLSTGNQGSWQLEQQYNFSNQPNQQVQVNVPNGCQGGTSIKVKMPDGRLIDLMLPPNAKPGDAILVDGFGRIISMSSPITSNYPGNNISNIISQQSMPDWRTFPGRPYAPIGYGLYPASEIGQRAPLPSGKKKALLVGINYKGTRAALKGCVNDAYRMKHFLLERGYVDSPTTMVCLTDDQYDPMYLPTKDNILRGMQWLVHNAGPGDLLFFHYSGHGAQETDNSGHERDGLNETLLPLDFDKSGMISDDVMWDTLVYPLPSGCRLITLMDCCHCGTGLDLSYIWKNHNAWYQEVNPSFAQGDVVLFSGCDDHQTSSDSYNKWANAPGGAMTTAFIEAYQRNPYPTYAAFLFHIHQNVQRNGFTQVPHISSSQRFDPNIRVFDIEDGFEPNRNEKIGKLVTHRFPPQKPNFGNSPLGAMLLAAGFAVLAAPLAFEAVDAIGDDIADGGFFDGGFFDGGFGF